MKNDFISYDFKYVFILTSSPTNICYKRATHINLIQNLLNKLFSLILTNFLLQDLDFISAVNFYIFWEAYQNFLTSQFTVLLNS